MEMEDQLTPTQIKILAGWSHNYLKGPLFGDNANVKIKCPYFQNSPE